MIQNELTKRGTLSVHDFMQLALTDPDDGYYTTHLPIGKDGDFVTAPEISQCFGELVGLWCVLLWQQMGKPESFILAECGPGYGTLMKDLIRGTSHAPGFYEAMQVALIEISPRLKAQQAKTLHRKHPHIHWYDSVDQLPKQPLILIANEFFDALPIHQFVYKDTGWCERHVRMQNTAPIFVDLPTTTVPIQKQLPQGSIIETCPQGIQALNSIDYHIGMHGGGALIIDYGYTKAHTHKSTLQAVKQHQYHDILSEIGTADLTAHVDFDTLLQNLNHCHGWGPITQGQLLYELGIDLRVNQLAATSTTSQRQLLYSAKERLIGAKQMGTLFKAIALTSIALSAPFAFTNTQGSSSHEAA